MSDAAATAAPGGAPAPGDLFLACLGWPDAAGRPDSPRAPTTRDVCSGVLKAAVVRLGCRLASAWWVDPVRRQLILADAHGLPVHRVAPRTIDCAASITGETVASRWVTRHTDLTRPDANGRSFSHPDLVAELGLTTMVSIPLLNTSNSNQVLAVINLFPGPGFPLASVEDATFLRGAALLANRIEGALRDRCDRFANRVGIEMGLETKPPTAVRLCGILARIVCRAVGCDHVDVYLEQSAATGTPALRASQEPGAPATDPDTAAAARQSWESNREWFGADRRANVLAVPMRNPNGQAKGVICCTNRARPDADPRPFTYDDTALVEAIGSAFGPHLMVLLADQRRLMSLDRLIHELRVPVVALRAVLERLQGECKRHRYEFEYDHFNEIETYCNIMSRQFNELDMTRTIVPQLAVHAKPVWLVPAIFAPTKRFVAPLLARRRFTAGQVRYDGLDTVRLWVDVDLMTQLVFNLMENAIKYYDGPEKDFGIEIVGQWDRQAGLTVVFRDFGIGVPDGLEEQIFEHGYRVPDAYRYAVTGNGIGLWLAREIARAHGGDLRLGRRADPTEVVLTLPPALASGPPEEVPKP